MLLSLLMMWMPMTVPQALALDVVPYQSGVAGKSTTVSTKGKDIPIEEFVNVIMNGSAYPKTASYMGVPALLECRTLERRDGYAVVYQRTGGNAMASSRQYVIALKVTKQTETMVEIQWWLVRHTVNADGTFTGPYADTLNANRDKAVYTPYNHGTWRLDNSTDSIYYAVESDPGGSIPSWLVTQDAVMAFPLELMKTKWGITQ